MGGDIHACLLLPYLLSYSLVHLLYIIGINRVEVVVINDPVIYIIDIMYFLFVLFHSPVYVDIQLDHDYLCREPSDAHRACNARK